MAEEYTDEKKNIKQSHTFRLITFNLKNNFEEDCARERRRKKVKNRHTHNVLHEQKKISLLPNENENCFQFFYCAA